MIFMWHKRFKDGYDQRLGYPKIVTAKGNVSLVKEKVNVDHLRQLSVELNISFGSSFSIIYGVFGLKRI